MADEKPLLPLNDRQKRFCEIYAKCLNATQAARLAGYSGDTPTLGATGYENLQKPHIRAYVDELLAAETLSPSETIKSISDIAKGDLKQYFTVRHVTHTPKVTITLSEYIEQRKEDMENEDYIHRIALGDGLLGAGEALEAAIAHHDVYMRSMKLELIRLEVKLVKNPDATMIVDGEPELIEVAELDVARLVQDKEAGKIKSFQATNAGAKVELYDADAALTTLAKYHGLLEKHNRQRGITLAFGFDANEEEYVD